MGLMEAMSGWLKQIVAVVLLAALVDLVLPNRTMQRYVRLVAGLIILLTIATPVLQWIRGDFDSKLAAGMQAVELNPQAAPDELARIEAEGRKWRERGSLEAASLTAARLQEAIRQDVELAEGVDVADVSVELQRTAGGTLDVRSVTVTLAAADAGEAAEAARPGALADADMQPVEAVKPVTVTDPEPVRAGGEGRTAAAEEAAEAEAVEAVEAVAAETEADPAVRSRIEALIAARYGIASGRIRVAEAGGGQGR